MKRVKNIYQKLGGTFMLFGTIFMIIGVVCYFANTGATEAVSSNLTMIFPLIGGFLYILGTIFSGLFMNNEQKEVALLASGKRTNAKVVSVKQNKFVKSRGKKPYVVSFEYEYGEEIFYGKSNYCWDEPNLAIGEEFKISVDKNKPNKYAVKFKADKKK